MLCVKLFCGGVQFFENFTLCDLDKIDVILRNTFLDAYKVNILCNGSKLRDYAKVGSKLVNLDAKSNFALTEVGVNLVVLVNELMLINFLVLIFLRVSQGRLKPQGTRQALSCILDLFNKFSKVIMDEFSNAFPPCKTVDHKI
jgi:hypothetical protein